MTAAPTHHTPTNAPGVDPAAAARAEDAGARAPLVRAAAAGDRDAMNDLWHESRRWVAAILLAHAPRGTAVDDLLQTVALQFVRKIHQVRDPEAFRPWLRTVAINAARAEGRALARRIDALGSKLRLVGDEADTARSGASAVGSDGRSSGPLPGPLSGTRTGSAAVADEARRVLELARELPESYREPLLLRCARGMSYTQISAVLGLPETTIETRIARGRRMLRERLARADQPGTLPGPGPGLGPSPGPGSGSGHPRSARSTERATR